MLRKVLWFGGFPALLALGSCLGAFLTSGKSDRFISLPAFSEGEPAKLPILEDESSPFFSRQSLLQSDGSRVEVLCYRRDFSQAKIYFGKNNQVWKVEAFCLEADSYRLCYEADYDEGGRRIRRFQSYDACGKLKTRFERRKDGSENYVFYRDGKLLQELEWLADGTRISVDHALANGASRTETRPVHEEKVLAFWDAGKTLLRLKVLTGGGRLLGFEYYRVDGKLEHRAKVLADGSLEFFYPDDSGNCRVRQLWRLLGEDWERPYYALSSAERFASDGKTVEHKISLRSNGTLRSHERFNSVSGKLEMKRDFDLEGRVARVEEYSEAGLITQLRVFPASEPRARGFVPDGMRVYPGFDQRAGNVYRLSGVPFEHSVQDHHDWAFFQVSENQSQN